MGPTQKGESVMEDVVLTPPDVVWGPEAGSEYRPSWSGYSGYVNVEHAGIWQETKDLDGWQANGDSEKLYEMALHNGAVILEIGTWSGRSAVVELRGALAAHHSHGKPLPQFYGIDVDPGATIRTHDTLSKAGLQDHVLIYHGNLAAFIQDVPIVPTMVFVDGDHTYQGVRSDLRLLRGFLQPGTPVFCHDYYLDGVRQAVAESIGDGAFEGIGTFGCGVLLRASAACPGKARRLDSLSFACAARAHTQAMRRLSEKLTADGAIAYLQQEKATLEAALTASIHRLREEKASLEASLCDIRGELECYQNRLKELAGSRWRKLGRTLGLAKKTSWE
jgi:hypothetical protein